jgi:hypothetical protein
MSSDNYHLIRRAGNRWALTDESASNADEADTDPVVALWHPTPIDSPRVRWFDDLDAARAAAANSYAEYGTVEALHDDATDDTFANRLAAVAGSIDGTYCEHLRSNDHAAKTATLHLGDVTVTIAAADPDRADAWDRVCEYTTWVSATAPGGLTALNPTVAANARAEAAQRHADSLDDVDEPL